LTVKTGGCGRWRNAKPGGPTSSARSSTASTWGGNLHPACRLGARGHRQQASRPSIPIGTVESLAVPGCAWVANPRAVCSLLPARTVLSRRPENFSSWKLQEIGLIAIKQRPDGTNYTEAPLNDDSCHRPGGENERSDLSRRLDCSGHVHSFIPWPSLR
jgi:hypothetical protein